jgi:hypothetical protein
MTMANQNGTCTINHRQQQTFHVDVFDSDGHPDTVSPLTASTPNGSMIVTVDPNTKRDVTIAGVSPSSGNVQILVPGSGPSSGTVFIAVTVTQGPDLRHIDLTPGAVVDKP